MFDFHDIESSQVLLQREKDAPAICFGIWKGTLARCMTCLICRQPGRTFMQKQMLKRLSKELASESSDET